MTAGSSRCYAGSMGFSRAPILDALARLPFADNEDMALTGLVVLVKDGTPTA